MARKPVQTDLDFQGRSTVTGLRHADAPGDAVPLGQFQELVADAAPAAKSYQETFSSALTPWIVNHNLGVRPNVSVLSPGGVEVEATVTHVSLNQCRVDFVTPQPGMVRCV